VSDTRAPTVQRRLDALADAIDLLGAPTTLFDPQGSWIASNRAAVEGDLVAHRFGDMMPPYVREASRSQFARCVELAEPVQFETLIVAASGEEAPVWLRLLPLSADHRVVGVLVVAYETAEETLVLSERTSTPTLTRRQHEILTLLAAAHSTTEIAERLGLSRETVRNHVRALLKELDAHSRLEAVVSAERLGLLPPVPFRAR
jgi:DNA-binding CsgD family transcriptional regulator